MPSKKVSLSLHRNTVEKRRARSLSEHVVSDVGNITKVNDIRAFAFVAIDAKGAMHASWDTGSIMPMWAFPATVQEALRVDIESSGLAETWRPSLPLKG